MVIMARLKMTPKQMLFAKCTFKVLGQSVVQLDKLAFGGCCIEVGQTTRLFEMF